MSFQPDAIDSKSELMEMMGIPSKPEIPLIDTPQSSGNEFSEQSAAFWNFKGKELSNAYEKGSLVSNFNTVSKYEYESFLLNLIRVMEEIIRDELIKKGHTLDETKHILKSLEEMCKTLSFVMNSKVKPQEISVKSLVAALHGFINTYAEKIK